MELKNSFEGSHTALEKCSLPPQLGTDWSVHSYTHSNIKFKWGPKDEN